MLYQASVLSDGPGYSAREDLALNGLSLDLTLGSSVTAGSLEAQSHVHECCCPERSSDNVDFPGDDDEVATICSTEFRLV